MTTPRHGHGHGPKVAAVATRGTNRREVISYLVIPMMEVIYWWINPALIFFIWFIAADIAAVPGSA